MVVFAGQGDVHRSMALLWRTAGDPGRTSPGPKPGLTVDAIVDAAIALADSEGMTAVSMRTVGKHLGRSGMALYTYVPSKSELIDLMYDRALAELPTEYDVTGGWRPAVTEWARANWEFYLRHPWVLQVSTARPVLGPNEFASMEALVKVFGTTPLPALAVKQVVGSLANFVRGAAQMIAESRQAPAATGTSENDWWYARSAALDQVAPDLATRFPALVRMEADGQYPPDDSCGYLEREAAETFKAGLEILLDGVEVAISRGYSAP